MQSRARGIRWFVLLGITVWCGVAALPQPGRSSCAPPEQDCACVIAAGASPDTQIIRAEILELGDRSARFFIRTLEGGRGRLQAGSTVHLYWANARCASPVNAFAVGDEVWGRVTPTLDPAVAEGESEVDGVIDALLWKDEMLYFNIDAEDGGYLNPNPIPESQRGALLNYGACERTFGDQSPPCDDTVDNTDIFCSVSSLGGR